MTERVDRFFDAIWNKEDISEFVDPEFLNMPYSVPLTGLRTPFLTWLHRGGLMYSPEITKRLVDAKADINLQGKYGQTIIHEFINLDYPNNLHACIDLGANVNITDNDNCTPLELVLKKSVVFGKIMCKALIRAGANVLLNQKQKEGAVSEILCIVTKYRRRFAACKSTQLAFQRCARRHQMVPDMVRLIGSLIWATRFFSEW